MYVYTRIVLTGMLHICTPLVYPSMSSRGGKPPLSMLQSGLQATSVPVMS